MRFRPLLTAVLAAALLVPTVATAESASERRSRETFIGVCATVVACVMVGGLAWTFAGCRRAPEPPREPSLAETRREEAAKVQAKADDTALWTIQLGKRMSDADYQKKRAEALKASNNLEDYIRHMAKALGAPLALEEAWVVELRAICDKEWLDAGKVRLRDIPGVDEGRYIDQVLRAVMVRHVDRQMADAAKVNSRSQILDTMKIALFLPVSVFFGADAYEEVSQATVDMGGGAFNTYLLAKKFAWMAAVEETKARGVLRVMWNTGVLTNQPKPPPTPVSDKTEKYVTDSVARIQKLGLNVPLAGGAVAVEDERLTDATAEVRRQTVKARNDAHHELVKLTQALENLAKRLDAGEKTTLPLTATSARELVAALKALEEPLGFPPKAPRR